MSHIELPQENPFAESVVADARQNLGADVPSINLRAFETCLKAVERARKGSESASVLLYGIPGSGKTHLLARLRTQLDRTSNECIEHLSVVASVRLNASPRRLWRHVREQLAEDLRRNVFGRTTLDRLVAVRLSKMDHKRNSPELWFEWLKQPQKDVEGIHEFLDETVKDRNLTIVLAHLFLGQHKLDARAWLRGDSLPESALGRLGLATDDTDQDLDPEARAQRVIQALCRLGAPAPFVFCFDQIEALQNSPGDRAGLFAFGRMAAELHDTSHNCALISCIQSAFRDTFRDAVREADWHRFQKVQVQLEPPSWPEARAVIVKRLEGQPGLDALRKKRGECFPLNEAALAAIFENEKFTVRKLVSTCAEQYENARGLHVESMTRTAGLDQFLENEWSGRLEKLLGNVPVGEADGVLEKGLPQAFGFLAPGWKEVTPPEPDITLAFENPVAPSSSTAARHIAVSICNQGNMISLAGRLRHLAESMQTGKLKGKKLILIRQNPISPLARKAREYLKTLTDGGAALITPSPEALAALAVMRDLLAEAQSGDLSSSGETVKPETVRSWLAAHMPEPVNALISELGAPSADPDLDLKQDLLTWLGEKYVTSLDDAAAALKKDSATIRACVSGNSVQFGLLEGPPVVVFHRTPDNLVE